MKLHSKLIATGALALLLAPVAAPAEEEVVLIDGFDEHQWYNTFGFGGSRNTDPGPGALMRYFPGVSNGGEGSMGYTVVGLNETTGWAGVFTNARDRNDFIGENRDMRFRFISGSFDVRIDSQNGNRPWGFKFETQGQPGGRGNGSAVFPVEQFGEWQTIEYEINPDRDINDPEYLFGHYLTGAGITINYGAAVEGEDPFTTGDFTVYFDNWTINGMPVSNFDAKPRGRTRPAGQGVSFTQPWQSSTNVAVAATQFPNLFNYGPDVDPPFYLEFDDEFGEGNEIEQPGFFAMPESPTQGDRFLILTWSADQNLIEDEPGPDAGIVGISNNYYSEPVNLQTATDIKVDIYVPDWGQGNLPETVTLSLLDDNLIDGVQLGDTASATLNNPITARDTWTTLTFPMESFTNVTANGPDLSRIHHIEIALTGAGGDQDGFATARLAFDNLRFVGTDPIIPPDPFVGDINGDGVVNVADVTELANILATGGTLPPLEVGDINGDGVIDELDVQALAEAIANGDL